jgi:hypothetical protein
VGPSRHAAALGLHFFERDLDAERAQPVDQAPVTVAPRFLQPQQPFAELGAGGSCTKLSRCTERPWKRVESSMPQTDPAPPRAPLVGAVVPGERIVVRDGQRPRFAGHWRRSPAPPRCRSRQIRCMGVKIDQKEISPRAFSLPRLSRRSVQASRIGAYYDFRRSGGS